MTGSNNHYNSPNAFSDDYAAVVGRSEGSSTF
jgi:hypothetical protein